MIFETKNGETIYKMPIYFWPIGDKTLHKMIGINESKQRKEQERYAIN